MKMTKRWLSVLLCVLMTVMILAVTVTAADGETNVELVVDKTEVSVDDTFTVSFGNKAMKVKGFSGGFTFDKTLLECVSIVGVDPEYPEDYSLISSGRGGVTYTAPTAVSTIEKANEYGTVGYAYAGTKDVSYLENTLYIVTFKAKESGTASFTLYEESNGTDAFKSDSIETITLTITEAAPACEHPEEKLTSEVIDFPTCEEPGMGRITCECGHSYNEEIPAYHNNNMEYHPEKDAIDCANPGNIEHWYCPGCYEYFGDAYAQTYINPWYIEITVDCVRPEGIADCAMFTCETCGNENYGYGEHDVLACKGGVCSKCNAEIEGNGCENYDTPACMDGVCYYCGGFVAGFGHENGAWAPCCDGECAYGCGLLYPATEEHVDADSDDYCDNCYNHLHHTFENFDPCVGGECTICWAWVDGAHEYFYDCDQICMNCGELTHPDAAHKLIYVGAKTPDCTTDGNIEYWYCEYCGLHCLDEECTIITNANAVKIAASCSYNAIHMAYVPAACHYNGNYEYWFCANCDVYYLNEACTNITKMQYVIIPASKTTADYVPAKAATCTEKGNLEYWSCAECNQIWADEALTRLTNIDAVTTDKNPDNHTGEPSYTNNGSTHSAIYTCCDDAPYVTDEPHNFNNDDHKCVCGVVEEFTLTVKVSVPSREVVELTVPYGANLLEVLTAVADSGGLPVVGYRTPITNMSYCIGEYIVTGYSCYNFASGFWDPITATWTMVGDLTITQNYQNIGWEILDGGIAYRTETGYLEEGWHYIEEDYDDVEGGAWYYFCKGTDNWSSFSFRAEGVTRALYPTETINGITYGPDDRDLTAEGYPDAESALFVFDEDGKFLSTLNGLTEDNHWAVNGMLPWFVGLVEVDGDYYYFGSDNTMVTTSHRTGGKIYLTRDSRTEMGEDDLFVEGGIYFFGEDGKLLKNDGVAEVNGTLYYFDDYRLALKAGLVKEDGKYYYVRSNGALVVDQSYWIYNVNEFTDIVAGTYTFDENGVMDVNSGKNGVYEENGGLYYYVNGKRTYAGLMEYDGGYIYVRSNGQLVTGKYWITKTNDLNGFTERTYHFGADGKMLNGVVDGYYYENGVTVYKGLMEYNDGYIYVRSNGQLAVGYYWITKTNELAAVGSYEFDENGMMIIMDELPEYKNGVHYHNGAYYYFVEGVIVKGAGPIVWEDNIYYVRSNGQVATGSYWTSNENEILPSGRYVFDETGKLITE